ncbi:MAG: hypothetical protein O3B04_10225 [Chloroflexi bacterium]|nr:hypothetical protein [Chloroflexota bacterium]
MSDGVKAAVHYPAPVHLAAAKDDSRAALEMVLVEGDNAGLRICAADGFRMVTYVSDAVCEDEFKRSVPAPFLADLWRQRDKRKGRSQQLYQMLHIMSDGGVGYLDAETNQMRTTTCPDVVFPSYERILGGAIDDRLNDVAKTHVLEVGFDPKFLADIDKIFDRSGPAVRWLPGQLRGPQLFVAEMDNGKLLYTLMPKWLHDDKAFDLDTLEDWITPKNLVLRRQIEQLQSELEQMKLAAKAAVPNLKD